MMDYIKAIRGQWKIVWYGYVRLTPMASQLKSRKQAHKLS
jgi:hypothetical protein